MQKSPWDNDYRTRTVDLDDLSRSTSAPPPETSFLFGRKEGLVAPTASYFGGGDIGLDEKWTSSPRQSNSNRSPFANTDPQISGSLFLNSSRGPNGRMSVPETFNKPPPGFGSQRESSRVSDMLDRHAIGENLIRSQSAAPSLDGRLSMGPLPPGLGATSDTPLVSNLTPGDSYLEPAMDATRILQLGQRRPASTGVIGGGSINSSSSVLSSLGLGGSSIGSGGGGGAVRPAAKTLMDLIQEDFPPESSTLDMNGFRDEIYVERPRTTSPLSLQTRDYRYDEVDDRRGQGSGLSEALDLLRVRHEEYRHPNLQRQAQHVTHAERTATRQSHDGRILHHQESPMYASKISPPTRPQPQRIPQPVVYEQQQHLQHAPQGYGAQPQVQYVQTHIMPNGQTVYINVPAQQYAPQPVQYQQILQQIPAGIGPNGEQYISVVPVHQGGPPGPTTAYGYFSQDGTSPGGPTYIVNSQQQQQQQQQPQGQLQQQQQQPKTPTQQTRATGGSHRGPEAASRDSQRNREKGGRTKRGINKREPKTPPAKATNPLLETFKAKKNLKWTLLDIKGHVVDFCLDQNGSRFIQQRLEIGSDEEKNVVMEEVLPAVRCLRNDVFANYVVQKLFDFGSSKMRDDLCQSLRGEMLQLSLQMYGCRVVQKALESLDDDEIPQLLIEFHHNVLSCIYDQNGNHVIQKSIEVVGKKAKEARARGDEAKCKAFEKEIDFIFDDVMNNARSLSCHPYGCRVLQRILEHYPEPKKSHVLDVIQKFHRPLLDDQFGNYVIQHVLQFGRSTDRDLLLDIIVENGLLILCRQKFASNVVEKLLKYGNTQQHSRVIHEMLKIVDERTGEEIKDDPHGTSVVLLMVRDPFANYVVQTTLDVVSDPVEKHRLMEELNTHSTELKNYTFAKHIVTKLESWSSRASTP